MHAVLYRDLTRAVAAGMSRVDIATYLNHAFTAAVRACLEENPSVVDTRKYLGKAREVVAAEVSRLLQVLGYRRERSPSGGALRTQRSPVVENNRHQGHPPGYPVHELSSAMQPEVIDEGHVPVGARLSWRCLMEPAIPMGLTAASLADEP